ncbi:hypothetical protein PK35_01490 [Tamlana nanhaiensis]|uniref:Thioredoxin domain-containing protein n=1 Tax=Neotamlana nanhaiensis TaxID=1382798 RepID=A0A0D7W5T5_9FLAO|nr:TlpA disulfide reductase family protein [Tamlana nanhaiensis]KJD34496.1 hypothetical protein PK35_01490 [Tamlana nanhaiensis]
MKNIVIYSVLFNFFFFSINAQNKVVEMLNNTTSTTQLTKKVDSLLFFGSESDMQSIISYYRSKRNGEKISEITKKIIEKFPTGKVAANENILAISKQENVKTMETMVEAFLVKFENSDFDFDSLYLIACDRSAKNKSTEHFLKYFNLIDNNEIKNTVVKYCATMLIEKSPDDIEALLNETLRNYRIGLNNKDDYYRYVELYSEIFETRGQWQKALDYFEESFFNMKSKTSKKIKRYSDLLMENKQYRKAFVVLDSLIRSGQGNTELKNRWATTYKKVFPENDFNMYSKEIVGEITKQSQEDIIKKVVLEKAPDFTLKDIDGKIHTLEDFKGKYLVIDLWATWCGPCKRSFPAMQEAVNKYKNDKDVKFLFVHTWENSKTPKQDAVSYLNENGFNFDLYMDTKNPQTGVNEMAKALSVNSIPAKIIIDKNGNLRYKGSGFGGGDDQLVVELSALIDYVKAN